MSKKAAVPDAWDDDWESQADKADAAAEVEKAEEEVKVTKAERLARHDASMRKVWESASPEPEAPFFLATRDTVPLKTEFKPTLKLLSRKPASKVIQKIDPVTGLAKMTLEDDDDEEEQKKDQPTPEELRARAQREREEKQKRYNEARERILGPSSGGSSPGTVTPPTEDARSRSGKGRARGNGRQENSRPQSQSGSKELFDPNYTPKPGVSIQKRAGDVARSGRSTPRDDDQVIRAPKGPDGNGKGFGFANRGGKMG
ncbi:uncharacterized protein LY89DRAFT_659557 [Mollisia scopiformis]|uniref:Uncharacterized protein n=1 Tax=Mollisia scopiformis TaxID=149040 RepID=A0A132B6B0_MOLSC|nr:uncharacterized protein LY89DRAFT_659557 [Mollisia scopiformis]KUJ07942.1 hypothetical protein LY89DRAFT_659557 [Mollisia scopiformis]